MIYIFYQNKFGGTDMLLQRMELWLKRNDYVVASDMSNLTQNAEIDLVVTPTSEMYRLRELTKKGLRFKKVLVWSMGHGAFKGAFYNKSFENILFGIPKYGLDFYLRKLAVSLLKTNSLVFTDKVGLQHDLRGVCLTPMKEDQLLCPIAIKNYESVIVKKDGRLKIVFGWVGRISKDFKLFPLIKLIEDIESIARVRNEVFNLMVVGDGDGAEDLECFLKSLQFVEVTWVKQIDNKEIAKFIDANIDVLFAMGTSALDGANASTPTVIVQPFSCDDERPERGYRWIFDSKGYSLGEFASQQVQPAQVEVGIHDIFEDIERYGLETFSKKSKEYSTKFYEDSVFPKIFRERKIDNIKRDAQIYLYGLTLINSAKEEIKRVKLRFILRKNESP